MSIELLPCPFCGAAPKWSHHDEYTHWISTDTPRRVTRWQSSIHCTGCKLPHCSGFGTVAYEGGNALAHQYAMRKAADQWNRRADLAPREEAPPAAGAAQAVARSEHYDEVKATLQGAHGIMETVSKLERRV